MPIQNHLWKDSYSWAVEVSIYLKRDPWKIGLGKKLYYSIEEICKTKNISNSNALRSNLEIEDTYLAKNSIHFYGDMGYPLVGQFLK